MGRAPTYLSLIVLSFIFATGCTQAEWEELFGMGNAGKQPGSDPELASDDVAMRNSIGELVSVQGVALNQVRGFGLVVDLVDSGGSDGPEVVRGYLTKEIRRRAEIGGNNISAVDLLDSYDTAMVEIDGFIPAGARKGDRFDVRVRALGSETESLVGGRLFLADLKIYAATPSGIIGGKTLARAAGGIYVPPFTRNGRPTDNVDLRSGYVLGGGIVDEPRKIRLVLNDPRHSIARQIERTINSRYGGSKKIAEAESAGFIELLIPDFRGRTQRLDTRRLLELIIATPMTTNRSILDDKADKLIVALEERDGNPNASALALEAIGKPVIEKLTRLLDSPSKTTHFYASRTLLRLGEREGAIGVAEHAHDPKSDYRDEAILELGEATDQFVAGEHLERLLTNEDTDVRIAAYKALRKRRHPAIKTYVLNKDNMIMDVVDCRGKYLVYAQQTDMPRLAIFGKNMIVRPPAIFPGKRNDGRILQVQLSASPRAKDLTLVYTNKRTMANSPPLKAPLNLVRLVRYLADTPIKRDDGVTAFGVDYAEIVDIISAFVETDTLKAKLVVEPIDKRAEQGLEREESEF